MSMMNIAESTYSKRRFYIVTGANYGDEGKGLATAKIAHEETMNGRKVLVVLTNGGAQRGHTVETSTKLRHVFHHIGSGSFSGADSFLSEDFIVNPIIFRSEYTELAIMMRYLPKIYAHKKCRISTPFDMILNQMVEQNRGDKKHGSCGIGVWETIVRYNENRANIFTGNNLPEIIDYIITNRDKMSDMHIYNILYHHLNNIATIYMPLKFEEYGISEEIIKSWKNIYLSRGIIDHYINDLIFYIDHVTIIRDTNSLMFNGGYNTIIFENAQGLLLSSINYAEYPHVTADTTGSEKATRIISNYLVYGGNDIEVIYYYISRTYMTRHGEGFLDHEVDDMHKISNDMEYDKTNVPNIHQGSLRYAFLNMSSLLNRIADDYCDSRDKLNRARSISMNYARMNLSGILFFTHGTETNMMIKDYKQNLTFRDMCDKINGSFISDIQMIKTKNAF